MDHLRASATFVDSGCCFGQEIRFLIHREGVPALKLYGFDLEPAFIEMGQSLFCDGGGKLGATMVSGNLLAKSKGEVGQGRKVREEANDTSRDLGMLEGKMDVVHVASVLHSWVWNDMIRAAKRLVQLTRPQPGSLIVRN